MAYQRQIGQTDLYVNPIGLGMNEVGGHNIYPNLTDETGRGIIRTDLKGELIF